MLVELGATCGIIIVSAMFTWYAKRKFHPSIDSRISEIEAQARRIEERMHSRRHQQHPF